MKEARLGSICPDVALSLWERAAALKARRVRVTRVTSPLIPHPPLCGGLFQRERRCRTTITLDRLKRDFGTRHIPVQIIGDKKDRQRARSAGAFGFVERGSSDEALSNGLESIKKFLDGDVKNLLVVQDDASQRNFSLTSLLEGQ